MCVPSLARPYLIRSLAEALAYRDKNLKFFSAINLIKSFEFEIKKIIM